jgi:hypothetical protein
MNYFAKEKGVNQVYSSMNRVHGAILVGAKYPSSRRRRLQIVNTEKIGPCQPAANGWGATRPVSHKSPPALGQGRGTAYLEN